MAKFAFGKMALVAAVGLGLAVPAAAYLQRSPAYSAARSAGQVGEKPDGYLGTVGAQPEEIEDLVADLNIKRRANYTERAQAQNVTLQEYAFAQGCELIARTVQGEKYQTPAGSWETRTASPPIRDPRCPAV
jgi:uncharacterized protein YdbL (DUF1318 family)